MWKVSSRASLEERLSGMSVSCQRRWEVCVCECELPEVVESVSVSCPRWWEVCVCEKA